MLRVFSETSFLEEHLLAEMFIGTIVDQLVELSLLHVYFPQLASHFVESKLCG